METFNGENPLSDADKKEVLKLYFKLPFLWKTTMMKE